MGATKDLKTSEPMLSVTNPKVKINNPPGMIMMDMDAIDKIPWAELDVFPGLRLKYIHVDLEKGIAVQLLWIDKGVQLPVHLHLGTSMLFCLKGRFTYQPAGTIGPGGFGYEPFGTIHEPDTSMEEETLLWAINTHNELLQFYNEDGTLGAVQHLPNQLRFIRREFGEATVAHLNIDEEFWKADPTYKK